MNTPLDCQDLVELVTDYFENALSADDRTAFEEHLRDCEGCTNYVSQMRETIALTGTLTTDDIDPQMCDELLAVFRSHHNGSP
jgi:anti-sigma factor RsiW